LKCVEEDEKQIRFETWNAAEVCCFIL